MHKILIVDDEKPARDYIAELAAFYIPNSVITQVNSAQNALNCLKAGNFDLMFVDIDFGAGKMTGLDLLEEIKLLGKQIYTVIISAHYKFEYVVKGIELGAARYIPKPLDNASEQGVNEIICIDKPLYKEKVYDALKLYLNGIETNTINLKVPEGNQRIQIDNILAIETTGRNRVKVYTADSILQEVAHPLNYFHKLLPDNFRYICRNCIINMHKINNYNLKLHKIFINCINSKLSFTVSRSNMKELSAFLNLKNIEKDEE